MDRSTSRLLKHMRNKRRTKCTSNSPPICEINSESISESAQGTAHPYILELPLECFQLILSYLPPVEIFLQVAVCRGWKIAADDPLLYAELYKQHFSTANCAQVPSDWKDMLKKALQESAEFGTVRQLHRKLLWAARSGHDSMCKRIFREAETQLWLDIRANVKKDALLLATKMGHERVVAVILAHDKKNPINRNVLQGHSPLHVAAESGNLSIAKLLVSHHPARISEKNYYGTTPLHLASLEGHYEIVKVLLESSAVVNTRDNLLVTPLHNAVSGGFAKIVQLLIEYGADLNATTKHGHTPLDCALHEKNWEIVELLQSAGAQRGKKRKRRADKRD